MNIKIVISSLVLCGCFGSLPLWATEKTSMPYSSEKLYSTDYSPSELFTRSLRAQKLIRDKNEAASLELDQKKRPSRPVTDTTEVAPAETIIATEPIPSQTVVTAESDLLEPIVSGEIFPPSMMDGPASWVGNIQIDASAGAATCILRNTGSVSSINLGSGTLSLFSAYTEGTGDALVLREDGSVYAVGWYNAGGTDFGHIEYYYSHNGTYSTVWGMVFDGSVAYFEDWNNTGTVRTQLVHFGMNGIPDYREGYDPVTGALTSRIEFYATGALKRITGYDANGLKNYEAIYAADGSCEVHEYWSGTTKIKKKELYNPEGLILFREYFDINGKSLAIDVLNGYVYTVTSINTDTLTIGG